MKKYFYTDGKEKFGPFTFEELKEKEISRETLIWFEGLNEWKSAGEISELKDIFTILPPPVKNETINKNNTMENQNLNQNQPPKTWLLESILVTILCCLPFGIVGIVNASKVESKFYAGDIEGANRASQEAGKWTKIGFWVGLAVGIIYLIIIAVGAASEY